MQNWEAMQTAASYEQHNAWYSSMFAANIKQEPGTGNSNSNSPLASPTTTATTHHLEQYLKQQQQQQQQHPLEAMTMTPSPSNNDNSLQHFYESTANSSGAGGNGALQQQLIQQQQYQQHFQHAQQAAAVAQHQQQQHPHSHHHHLALGFNPLTPPGLPNAVIPGSMQHFYSMRQGQTTTTPGVGVGVTVGGGGVGVGQQSSSPHVVDYVTEKLQSALTPRNTPPMDVTPPKSPKIVATTTTAITTTISSSISIDHDKDDHDLISNSSEDMKYMAESECDDSTIRNPIYNSHGKIKNYKCKTCGVVAITKVAFWEHSRIHMKPDKILQCPKCPFVTEFKHHLEYHIRKHKKEKPFQCDKCSYTCVNKSMLNSHRKSHSSVYQYRCADCDYATKYCHSFKLHLRKYEHKPGMVLDEDGTPNPSLIIDVYGTRRGPKNKSATSGGTKRASRQQQQQQQKQLQQQQQQQQSQQLQQQQQVDLKPMASQLSAALQGFPTNAATVATSAAAPPSQVTNLPASPAKSVASVEMQQSTTNLSNAANLLPPLASILQQNRNMAFFPYWNLNLQMLAAQQQAAVLAQLSPRMREQLQQQQQQQQHQPLASDCGHDSDDDEEHDHDHEHDDDEDDDFERKSVDSAMDLSQGTPTKNGDTDEQSQHMTPAANTMLHAPINLKLQDDETPVMSNINSVSTTTTASGNTQVVSRRKGRVLKLETLLQMKSSSVSPEQHKPMPTSSSPINNNNNKKPLADCSDGTSSADESMEPTTMATTTAANTSTSSTASSSGNSSNASTSSTQSSSSSSSAVTTTNSTTPASVIPADAIYECKYCDIFFKDAVLHSLHMGYHSCDDVFKCNMCGAKCGSPVGLSVHVARYAHS